MDLMREPEPRSKQTFLEYLKENSDHEDFPNRTFFQIIGRLFLLKRHTTAEHYYTDILCNCAKLYQLRTRKIHQTDCIVGVAEKCFSKLKKLIDISEYTQYNLNTPHLFCKGQYEGLDSMEKKEEYLRITALRNDVVALLSKVCEYILDLPYEEPGWFDQDLYFVRQELFMGPYTPTVHIRKGCYGEYPQELFRTLILNVVYDDIMKEWYSSILNHED